MKHLVISESDDISQNYLVLPDTSLVTGFQYSGKLGYIEDNKQFVLSDAGITGLLDAYRTFQSAPSTGTVLVVFTELGASSFLRLPLNELFQQSLSLEHFFTWQQISEVKEKLLAARTDEERIQVVELFLISNLREQRPYPLVQGALEAIQQSKGTIRINKLAKALNTSQSPLEKKFRALIGTSPKKFAGIVRLRHMISALEQNNMEQAEHLSSYYDQAHFIKDFKRFTSFTPERYLRYIRQNGATK